MNEIEALIALEKTISLARWQVYQLWEANIELAESLELSLQTMMTCILARAGEITPAQSRGNRPSAA